MRHYHGSFGYFVTFIVSAGPALAIDTLPRSFDSAATRRAVGALPETGRPSAAKDPLRPRLVSAQLAVMCTRQVWPTQGVVTRTWRPELVSRTV
jgi:hypothetical protein